MRLRQHDSERPAPPAAPATDPATDQEAMRARGAALLSAADEAITRALSSNSAEFLQQNRQAGGE